MRLSDRPIFLEKEDFIHGCLVHNTKIIFSLREQAVIICRAVTYWYNDTECLWIMLGYRRIGGRVDVFLPLNLEAL